jgi:hypothetical protein
MDTLRTPPSRLGAPGIQAGVVAGLFALGLLLGTSGHADFLARFVADAYRLYVEAQYVMLQARDNVGRDGRLEYAVLAEEPEALARFVGEQAGWSVRPSELPGWQVVSTPADQAGALDLLQRNPSVRVAWRNRGLWVCH